MGQVYSWDEGKLVYLPADTLRIISFRPANRREREMVHEWLEIDGEVE
jgi:uncharacterized DUF497 family protein